MNKASNVENIIEQFRQLDHRSRMDLVDKLMKLLSRELSPSPSNFKLSDLNSRGNEIWHDIDVDDYILHERQWD